MVWVLVFVALVAASVYAAHRLLAGFDASASGGRLGELPRALVYGAAVVVGAQATDAAVTINQVSSTRLGLPSDDKTQAIVQQLSTHAADIAWQAGLLLAAAALVASVPGLVARRAD